MNAVTPSPGILDAIGTTESYFPAESPPAPADDSRPPHYSDDALALAFTEQHANLRYVNEWARWFEWSGQLWEADVTRKTFSRARAVCRKASADCNDLRAATNLASAKTVAAVERLAQCDRRHAATTEQWDKDPWLFNTPSGVVDLRTGMSRAHCPDDHMTKIAAVGPGGDCPQWRAFLDQITGGDIPLQEFLQRVAGYSLTGSIKEHALFFGYGTGGNGKGVFLNTITGIMAAYAGNAPMETFTATRNEQHSTNLAMLRGARLITAQETEEGQKWPEAKIKQLTGGDPITARFMRQDFFTFQPSFKLFIAGNHKPGLRNVDEAIRRRFNLIPFDVTIAAADRDPDLPEKLKTEWPGILQWMIAGCLEWQRIGLAAPDTVTAATDEYFEAEDAFGAWLEECCTIGKGEQATSADLFRSWQMWAVKARESPGSMRGLSEKLTAKGFTTKRSASVRGFSGLSVQMPAAEFWPQ